MHFDAFISHASEDKDSFVDSLAHELRSRKLNVWYDRFTVKVGDRLTDVINKGMSESRFGVVVLSKMFLAKEWTKRELSGLLAKEADGSKVLLPVWHGIEKKDLLARYPELADRVAIRSSDGVKSVADSICGVIMLNAAELSNDVIAVKLQIQALYQRKRELERRYQERIKECLEELLRDGGVWEFGGITTQISDDRRRIEAVLGEIYPGNARDLSSDGWRIENFGWSQPPGCPEGMWNYCHASWEVVNPDADIERLARRIWRANDMEGFAYSAFRRSEVAPPNLRPQADG